ncbi:L,D-transpeptidase [Thiofilum flexile]|uniref:L,D-transpeptidase n=1 Tax=Thiofilum flexile TaxID=125627 RepID=UPI00035CF2D4|nr:L,D-transpeptidase [Thiofilum flexile]
MAESIPLTIPPLAESAPGAQGGFGSVLQDLARRFPQYPRDTVVLIDATSQELILIRHGQEAGRWTISTAEAGLGSKKGSNQTPLGVHRIATKIGANAPLGTVFKARANSGRIARILTAPGARSGEDNVTTRILWLDGLEPGLNKGGNVDSKERFIYIHGTDEEGRLGAPASHGCIRMRNQEVVDLFNQVDKDTLVVIAQRK